MTDDLRKLTRRELYKLVWETPVYQLAPRFGLSGRGLGKLCDRHSIPVPPRGYWAEKAAGKRVIRPPLIEVETPKPLDLSITIARKPMPKTSPAGVGAETATGADPFRELWDHLWTETGPIRVPKTLTSPHPVIAAWIAEEQQELARYRSLSGGARSRSRFDTTIERRRLRILSTLLKELVARGFSVERDRYRPLDLWVRHGRDEVRFDIKERYRQVRRNLTDAEKADRWNAGREWTQTREASGELTLKITTYGPDGIQTSWKDDASGRLEEKLQSAVVGFLVVAAYAKHRRELNEAEEHRRWEALTLPPKNVSQG